MKTIQFSLQNNISTIKFINKDDIFSKISGNSSLTVFDINTARYFPDFDRPNIVLPAGEEHKTWNSVAAIEKMAIEENLGRDGIFCGVGGGVVCDVTAFAASVFMRGADLILVPTTLLSMVDASIGGKTGIDFQNYKNMIGTFYPAREVRVCLEMLQTLPDQVYRAGLAEVIKHALLKDVKLLRILETERVSILRRDMTILQEIVYRALKVKVAIVEKDFREQGMRVHLNLGHTFGHALESVTGFSVVSHGEAVAWGINMAMKAGVKLGLTDPAYAERVEKLLLNYDYQLAPPYRREISREALINAMKYDKKKKSGTVRFVLQKKQGDTLTQPIEESILREVL